MDDLAALPVPPWERLSACIDDPAPWSVNVAVDAADESRPGPVTGVWWHAQRIADSVFVDLTDWTSGPTHIARYILRLDGSVEFARWADGVDPQALTEEALNGGHG